MMIHFSEVLDLANFAAWHHRTRQRKDSSVRLMVSSRMTSGHGG